MSPVGVWTQELNPRAGEHRMIKVCDLDRAKERWTETYSEEDVRKGT